MIYHGKYNSTSHPLIYYYIATVFFLLFVFWFYTYQYLRNIDYYYILATLTYITMLFIDLYTHSFSFVSAKTWFIYVGTLPYYLIGPLILRETYLYEDLSLISKTIILIIPSLFSFSFGCRLSRNFFRIKNSIFRRIKEEVGVYNFILSFNLLVAVVSNLYIISLYGGFTTMMDISYNAQVSFFSRISIVGKAMYMLKNISLSLTIILITTKLMVRFSKKTLFLYLVIITIVVSFAFLFHVRGYLMLIVTSFLASYNVFKKQLKLQKANKTLFVVFLVVFILVLLLMLFMTFYREGGYSTFIRSDKTSTVSFEISKIARSYDMYDEILVVVKNVGNGDNLLLGKSMIAPLYVFIPRSFFPEKPTGFGLQVAIWQGFSMSSHVTSGVPLPAEIYANFGILITILTMFLLGMGIEWVVRSIYFSESFFWKIILVILLTSLPGISRGDFMASTSTLFVELLEVILLFGSVNLIKNISKKPNNEIER